VSSLIRVKLLQEREKVSRPILHILLLLVIGVGEDHVHGLFQLLPAPIAQEGMQILSHSGIEVAHQQRRVCSYHGFDLLEHFVFRPISHLSR